MEPDTLPEPAECLTVSDCWLLAEIHARAGWVEARESILEDMASIAAGRVTVH